MWRFLSCSRLSGLFFKTSGKIFLLCLLVCGWTVCEGQTRYKLTGTVSDSKKEPVPVGDVLILSPKDSSIVKYAPLLDGKFTFDSVNSGDYLLKIYSFGFEEKLEHVSLDKDINLTVTLVENAYNLDEVSITDSRKIFTNKNGNIRINIENSILSSIPDPVDLLSKMPGVMISSDRESISVIGKGEPLIYIDNQRMTMNDLNTLSVNDIKSIEIINNPSAKYEAEGKAVVLITRKANKNQGIKVDLSESVSFKRFFHTRTGAGLSVKRKRLEFKSNFQFNRLNLWESNSNQFTINNADIVSQYTAFSKGPRTQYIYGAGLYYQINDDDYFSVSANGRIQHEPFTIFTDSYLRDHGTETTALTTNVNQSSRPYITANVNYNKKWNNAGAQLFTGVQYSKFDRKLASNIFNDFNHTESILTQDRDQHFGIDLVTARADFEKKFKNETTWESGLNTSHASARSLLDISNYQPVYISKSDYRYVEQNYAAYTQLSGKLGIIGYSGGLRMENTRVKGQFADSATLLVDKNYTRFFPKINIEIPLDSTKTLSLNYSRSINRPSYANANQITTYINPFFEWSHNININPSLTDAITATIQYQDYSLQVSCYRQKDPVYYNAEYNEEINRLRMIDRNFDKESGANATLTIPLKYKWWSATNLANVTLNKVSDPSASYYKSRPYFYLYSNHQIALPGGYACMVSGWWVTRRYEGLFERNALFAVDLGISKTFFKRLTCAINFNDIFRSLKSTEKFFVNNVQSDGVYYEDVREIAISIKYTFGKMSESKYKNKDVDENPDRVK